MDVWVASRAIMNKATENTLLQIFCEHMFLLLLGK